MQGQRQAPGQGQGPLSAEQLKAVIQGPGDTEWRWVQEVLYHLGRSPFFYEIMDVLSLIACLLPPLKNQR